MHGEMFNTMAVKVVQINITLRFHLTPVKWLSRIKEQQTQVEMQEGKESLYTVGECKLVYSLWKEA
jgi:hypothetical protein